MEKDPKDNVLMHQSGVNKHGEPFIQLLINNKVIAQLTPEQAREHAHVVMEAAEASEQDAFMLDWTQRVVGVDAITATGMIWEFRKWREQRTGKKTGQTVRPEGK